MARGKMKKKEKEEDMDMDATNPEALERKRLKALAFSNNTLSETPARSSVHLNPSSMVAKHHGKDILKKSHRKSRFLFSFPGLLAPISGGKIGELKDLGTKNPILYLDFPQGQMKLFGTIVYPKNRYLTLQFSRGGKSVMCEDCFDNMIVFSDAWWIGRKDENPEEARLEFPKELHEGQQAEYDFKGGAGAASVVNQGVPKTRIQRAEQESPKTPTEDDLSDSEINSKDTKEVVPVRHSGRTARKSYKFAEISSGDDSGESSPDLSEHEEKVIQKKSPCSVVVDIDNEDAAQGDQLPKENKECASGSKSKKVSQFASAAASNEVVSSNRGSLVQATISTLFKKVEEKMIIFEALVVYEAKYSFIRSREKTLADIGLHCQIVMIFTLSKAPRNSRKSLSSKVSGQKLQPAGSKRKIDLDEGSRKRARKIKDKDPGENITAKSSNVEDDDDTEEFSNASEDSNGSDEDWTA